MFITEVCKSFDTINLHNLLSLCFIRLVINEILSTNANDN